MGAAPALPQSHRRRLRVVDGSFPAPYDRGRNLPPGAQIWTGRGWQRSIATAVSVAGLSGIVDVRREFHGGAQERPSLELGIQRGGPSEWNDNNRLPSGLGISAAIAIVISRNPL
jgi:hypothetical protein